MFRPEGTPLDPLSESPLAVDASQPGLEVISEALGIDACEEVGPEEALPADGTELPPFPEVTSEIARSGLLVGAPLDLDALPQIGRPSLGQPEAAPSEPLCLKVAQPRCPFCHDEISPGVLQEACKACRAWHHEACWAEGGSRCSACRAPSVTRAIHIRPGGTGRGRPGVDSDLAVSWALIASSSLAYSLILTQILSLGFSPASLGHALTHGWGAIPSLLALSCLFVASGLRPGEWRVRFHRAAWGIVGLTGVLTLYAMICSPRVLSSCDYSVF